MLTMDRCIYCLKPTIPREQGIGPLNPSLEHIVPYSLGGSDDFATRDAHVGCNSSLGDTVDADCINQPYLTMLRQRFGIKGRSGAVPRLEMTAHSSNGNEPATMRMPHGGPVTFKHEPIVLRQPEPFGEQILVVADDGDVKRIVGGIVAGAEKRGHRTVDRITGERLDLDASLAAAPRELHAEYSIDMRVDLTALRRQLVKIAFGFAHLILGWRWTAGPDARRMRAIAKGAGSAEDVEAFVRPVDPDIRDVLPMGDAGPDDHFVALLPMGDETRIVMSLFSHLPLSGGVHLQVGRDVLEAGIAQHNRAMATIDHQTRRTTWVSFVDFTDHLARRVPPDGAVS